MSWSLLPTISAPMPLQMALDELLFVSQKYEDWDPTLRFYVSSEPWISVGYSFQDSVAFEKSDLILQNPQVPVCRRVTGGGCVLHGRDLIFSLTARYAERESPSNAFEGTVPLPSKGIGTLFEKQKLSQSQYSPIEVQRKLGLSQLPSNKGESKLSPLGSVRTSYAKIHEGVRMGLRSCGFDPKYYSAEDELPKGNDCFDFPVESDLAWKGKKIAGGAQKRSEGVLLHHESISIPPGVERDHLIRAILKGFEATFSATIENSDLDPELYFQAEKLTKTTDNRLRTAV